MKKKDSRSKYYILFIDDEEKSVKYFQNLFGQYFNVVSTTDPQEVLKIIDIVTFFCLKMSGIFRTLNFFRPTNSWVLRILNIG